MFVNDTPLHLLKSPADKPVHGQPGVVVEERDKEKPTDPETYILCRQCSQVITSRDNKISVEGLHHHTFANPHGMVFDIGCFRSVTGCGYAGTLSGEFTWFKGFSWRVAVCGMCLSHLGWLFVSGGGKRFHGLILDRLVET